MDKPLEIRGKPRPTTHFSKPALIAVAGGVVLLLFVALMVALKPPNLSGDAMAQELYNVANKPQAEGLESLASDYSELEPDPVVDSVLGRLVLYGDQLDRRSRSYKRLINPRRLRRGRPVRYRPAAHPPTDREIR